MEIAAATDHPAGAEAFLSHLPVHQDGSCNGLQHYSALGRDLDGARSVNVFPSEKPQDVYTEVAKLVEASRAKVAFALSIRCYTQMLPMLQTTSFMLNHEIGN